MNQSTADRLVTAAAKLLEGGVNAVTLRAVAKLVGISHNAPYKHFKDRNALLAAVAERDFRLLRYAFDQARGVSKSPLAALKTGMAAFIAYGREHPARYRLLFSDPELSSQGGRMEAEAMAAFHAFGKLVADCQAAGSLPATDAKALTALLYGSLHGLIDLELGGRARESKGLGSIETVSNLLLKLISPDQDLLPKSRPRPPLRGVDNR